MNNRQWHLALYLMSDNGDINTLEIGLGVFMCNSKLSVGVQLFCVRPSPSCCLRRHC